MKSIRITNLRGFRDTGEIEIAPLTILLGKNSAGKSTFLRTFPLLRQSSEVKTLNDVLWFGDYVDFGTFWDSLRYTAVEPQISFRFRFDFGVRAFAFYSPLLRSRRTLRDWMHATMPCEFELWQIARGRNEDSEIVSQYVIRSDGNEATLEVAQDLSFKKFVINGEDATSLVGALRVTRQAQLLPSFMFHDVDDTMKARLVDVLRGLAHHRISEVTLDEFADRLIYGPRDLLLQQLRTAKHGDVWSRRTSELTRDSPEIVALQRVLFVTHFNQIFDAINGTLSGSFANVRYITPLRASAERYYRHRGVAVDEIAPNGENLAMFLQSLSHSDSANFAEWTAEHMGFSVLVESHPGHVSIVIESAADKTRVNLADVGFGYSQVIPILAQIWQISQKRQRSAHTFVGPSDFQAQAPIFFLVEQPELHLHPRMQGRLMELFAKVLAAAKQSRISLKVMLETHSETLVAKAGRLVAEGQFLTSEDARLYIFDSGSAEESVRIRASEFDADGALTDWPYDFFDCTDP